METNRDMKYSTEMEIKLIWDFRGPDSLQTANHYLQHLKESPLLSNKRTCGVQAVSEVHSLVYLVILEHEIPRFRDALRPHRATYVN